MNSHQRRIQRRHIGRLPRQPYCGYWHGGTIECRGDGYMWDADYDGYDPDDHSMPCPCCNTQTYLDLAKEEAESTVSYFNNSGHGTGETIWCGAVRVAERANAAATKTALLQIGIVKALTEADDGTEDAVERTFIYSEAA